MLKTTVSVLALLLAAPASVALAQPPAPATAQSEDARLAAFFQKAFMEQVALSPETQTQLGLKTHYGELDDYTDAANRKRLDLSEAELTELKRFDYARLSHASQLSYRLFEDQAIQARDLYKWRWHQFTISTEGSVAGQIPVLLLNSHSIDDVSDAEAYVSRLNAVERVMNEVSADLIDRANRGFVAPAFAFKPVMDDARQVIVGAPFDAGPADAPVWADFKKKVSALKVDDAAKAKLLAEGEAALKGPFRRGYERFISAVAQVQPRATSTDGVWRLPDGAAYYAATVKFFTTTDLTPTQIHDIGLKEVDRIHAEMEQIKARVGFKGTLRQFLDYVKTDARFHYPNTPEGKQQFLDDAKAIIANYMKTGAPQQFAQLPRNPLEVKAVEPWREKTAPVAFYNQGTPDGSKPGIYYVNLSDMTQVAKPQIEAVTCHEGTPGHHFQISRSLEQQDLPMFRRFAYYGAYAEGWGLYAERLCKEAGGYADPYSDLGREALEVWRATRLVVDTGIHFKHWSRDQAMQYFRDNTMLSDRDIQKEVDRYIANPGQATSYKIGQLRILALREKAKTALGPKFDIKDFHEVVLKDGALPLDVLEAQVDAYIAAKKAG